MLLREREREESKHRIVIVIITSDLITTMKEKNYYIYKQTNIY